MSDYCNGPKPTHVSVADAAVMLNVSPTTVKRMLAAGRLPFIRTSDSPAGHIRIPIDAIRALGGSTRAPDVPMEDV